MKVQGHSSAQREESKENSKNWMLQWLIALPPGPKGWKRENSVNFIKRDIFGWAQIGTPSSQPSYKRSFILSSITTLEYWQNGPMGKTVLLEALTHHYLSAIPTFLYFIFIIVLEVHCDIYKFSYNIS
jgi:hypothetical protein